MIPWGSYVFWYTNVYIYKFVYYIMILWDDEISWGHGDVT